MLRIDCVNEIMSAIPKGVGELHRFQRDGNTTYIEETGVIVGVEFKGLVRDYYSDDTADDMSDFKEKKLVNLYMKNGMCLTAVMSDDIADFVFDE